MENDTSHVHASGHHFLCPCSPCVRVRPACTVVQKRTRAGKTHGPGVAASLQEAGTGPWSHTCVVWPHAAVRLRGRGRLVTSTSWSQTTEAAVSFSLRHLPQRKPGPGGGALQPSYGESRRDEAGLLFTAPAPRPSERPPVETLSVQPVGNNPSQPRSIPARDPESEPPARLLPSS